MSLYSPPYYRPNVWLADAYYSDWNAMHFVVIHELRYCLKSSLIIATILDNYWFNSTSSSTKKHPESEFQNYQLPRQNYLHLLLDPTIFRIHFQSHRLIKICKTKLMISIELVHILLPSASFLIKNTIYSLRLQYVKEWLQILHFQGIATLFIVSEHKNLMPFLLNILL